MTEMTFEEPFWAGANLYPPLVSLIHWLSDRMARGQWQPITSSVSSLADEASRVERI